MENYENEVNQQAESQPEVTAQAQPQPETQQSAYHGAGVGQRETPFTNTPYGTVPGYQPYRQPAGQPWEPWNQPRQTPAKPTKAKKVMGKVFKTVACCVLTAVLVAQSPSLS